MRTSSLSTPVACALLAVLLTACGDDDDHRTGPSPTPSVTAAPSPTSTAGPTRPVFDWGYPQYSEYVDGHHVGTTLYQQDPTCQHRLTFYECSLIDAQTPDNDRHQPDDGEHGDDRRPRFLHRRHRGGAAELLHARRRLQSDACRTPAWAPGQASSDNLAWQLFIALNWPADPAQPGLSRTPPGSSARSPDRDRPRRVGLARLPDAGGAVRRPARPATARR